MKGHLYQYRFDGTTGNAWHLPWRRVSDIALNERQGREKANIEILAQFQIGHNTQIKARPCHQLCTGESIIADKIFRVIHPEVTLVEAQRNAEVIRFSLKIQIIDVTALPVLRRCKGQHIKEE